MGIVGKLKRALSSDAEENTYQCNECGETFKSYIDPDDHWVKCDHCDGRDVTLIEDAS